MSEKWFTTKNIICSNYCVWDNNDKPYGNDEVVELLNEQQDTINNLQEVVAELGATLLMNGFEIEINGENLSELMTDE